MLKLLPKCEISEWRSAIFFIEIYFKKTTLENKHQLYFVKIFRRNDKTAKIGFSQSLNFPKSKIQVTFPKNVSDLNVGLIEKDNFQVGIWCFNPNPYAYVDNFDLLITSDAMEAHLKDLNQQEIP